MKKKERHIGKFFRDPLPEPEVSADDAWAGMNDILDAATGETLNNGHSGKWIPRLIKLKGPILTSLALVSVTCFIIYKIFNSSISTSDKAPVSARAERPKEPDETKTISNKDRKNPESRISDKQLPIPLASPIQARRESKVTELQGAPESLTTLAEKINVHWRDLVSGNHEKTDRQRMKSFKSNHKLSNNDDRVKAQNRYLDDARTKNKSQNSSLAAEEQESALGEFTPGTQSLKTELTRSSAKPLHIHSLKPLNTHFQTSVINLGRRVIVQDLPKQPESQQSKQIRKFHLGVEWSLNSSLKSTDYIASGADSIRSIGLLLIPGIFATKNWSKSSITVSYLPYQSYFGGNKLVSQQEDSLSTDSVKTYSSTLFVKAVGMTFSAQYQYHVTRNFALNAGASYDIFTSALFRPQAQTWQGKLVDGQLATLKKSQEMSPYINPRLFTFKAGIAFTPGRFQAGLNVILPLSNISASPQYSVKALNGQFYLRFLIW